MRDANLVTWAELARRRPDLAKAGRELLYYFGPGLGLLGTVRKDGGPRLHPICPVLTDDGLYAFIGPTPKLNDLLRDGRYALHSNPPPNNDDAFYVTGKAERREAPQLRSAVESVYFAGLGVEPWPGFEDEMLFELLVESCLLTRTPGHGGPYDHTVWSAQQTP
jgi:hypothetical protein